MASETNNTLSSSPPGILVILRLRQGDNTVAVLARVADEIQWPLTKDLAAVKLDPSRYFFSFCAPKEGEGSDSSSDDEIDDNKQKPKKKKNRKESENTESLDVLNYGLTIDSKGQEDLLKQLDEILEILSSFLVQQGEEKVVVQLDGAVAREESPADLVSEKKKKVLEERCAAYWTRLAPNVEEYSGTAE